MLAVPARLAGAAEGTIGRQRQAGLADDGSDAGAPSPRSVDQRGPRPSAAAASSIASLSKISAMYGQSQSSAALRRAVDSSVPSPRRTTQSAACCGDSALPSAPCRRCRQARASLEVSSASQSSSRKVGHRQVAQLASPRSRRAAARPACSCGSRARRAGTRAGLRRAPRRRARPRACRRASAQRAPGRSGRGPCSTARCLPRAPGRGRTTRRGAAPGPGGVAEAQQVLHRRIGRDLDRGLHQRLRLTCG